MVLAPMALREPGGHEAVVVGLGEMGMALRHRGIVAYEPNGHHAA